MDAVTDHGKQSRDRRAEEDQRKDRDHRDQSEDKCILGKSLALVAL